MDGSTIGLFIHVVGGLGLFVALGLEWTGVRQIRSTISPEQVRAWMGIFNSVRMVGFASMLALVLTGIYSMLAEFGPQAWIIVSLGSLVLVIALWSVFTRPRIAAVAQALVAEKGTVTKTFHGIGNDPILFVSIQTRLAIALGIVFLMIAKPELVVSLLTIGVAIVLGLVTTLPALRRERAQEGLTV